MNILILFVIFLLAKIELISSQIDNDNCWMFDFNDPSYMKNFAPNCMNYAKFVQKSYNAAVGPTPFRSTSKYYLTSLSSSNGMHCLQSLSFLHPGIRNFTMEIALKTNVEGTLMVQMWRPSWAIFTISNTENWKIVRERFSMASTDLTNEIKFQITATINGEKNQSAAFEYIKFYADDSLCANDHNSPEVPEEIHCPTIDFNQPPLSQILIDFDNCGDLQVPTLAIRSYENSTIPPYRESSIFHLSSRTEGMSCLRLKKPVTLDSNSRISSAIYLNSLWPGAWVEIYVYDKFTGDRQVVLSVESSSNEWRSLIGSVNRKFVNAQIFIETNAHIHNSLAIEFLKVTRTDNKCPTECYSTI